MTDKETEQWLSEMYKYTRDFDFRRLNKYEDANEDLHIDDLILDYTMLYEFYKKRTKKLQKENRQLKKCIKEGIGYVEKRDFVEVEIDNEPFNIDYNFKENILNILKGSDDNE
jgi:hypothetical protein